MKKWLLVLVAFAFVFSLVQVQPVCAASSARKVWKSAKKNAAGLFKKSEKKSMKKYGIKFNKKFGPTMDKLAKAKKKGKSTDKLQAKAEGIADTYYKMVKKVQCGKKDANCEKARDNLMDQLRVIESQLKQGNF